jgi:predicted nucleic acid-binding protein
VKALPVDYLVDAGPLVGAFWPADQWHSWSRKTLIALGGPAYTTETVFAEASHLLKRHTPALLSLFAALDAGLVRFRPVYPDHLARAAQLITDYKSFADAGDASLVILSELYPSARLITLDVRDFAIYRRKDGTPVPCIIPGAETRLS